MGTGRGSGGVPRGTWEGSPPEPRPLRGWRRTAALVWVGAVVLLYLAVREFGLSVVP